jgi:hypothetical protein
VKVLQHQQRRPVRRRQRVDRANRRQRITARLFDRCPADPQSLVDVPRASCHCSCWHSCAIAAAASCCSCVSIQIAVKHARTYSDNCSTRDLMKLRLQLLTRTLPQSLLNEQTRLTALAAHEAFRLNPTLAIRSDDNLNDLVQAAPPT